MRALLPITLVALGAVQAFPAYANNGGGPHASRDYTHFLGAAESYKASNGSRAQETSVRPGHRRFNALLNPSTFKYNDAEQSIDLTSAEHRFIPPGPNDIRGPCPGLNILANHGYLDRSGMTSLTEVVDATTKVFGLEYDLALLLSALGVVFNGNLLDMSYSIGGAAKASQGLGKVSEFLLGRPSGISAHNIYEGDSSTTRRDYYAPGANRDNVNLYMPYFQQLLDLGDNDSTPGKDVYDFDVMMQHKSNRWNESVSTNPQFFYTLFGGTLVTLGADRFVTEFAANNTADADGFNRIYLDERNLLAFYGVERNQHGALEYRAGHERLLPTWKRRPLGSTFGIDDIIVTVYEAALRNPHLLSAGGNTGTVNSYAGLDAGDLTGGVYREVDLLKDPANLACYIYQMSIEEVIPTQLNVVYKTAAEALDFVAKNIKAPFAKLAEANGNPCQKVSNPNIAEAYDKFPGSKVERPGQGEGLLGEFIGQLTGRK